MKQKTNLGDIGNKAKRTELYRKQKGDKKAAQKDRRRRREREAQELGEVGGFSLVLEEDGCVPDLTKTTRVSAKQAAGCGCAHEMTSAVVAVAGMVDALGAECCYDRVVMNLIC